MKPPSATPESDTLTLAELLRSEPMRLVEMHALAGLDRAIDEIRLLDDVEQVRGCRPGTFVVLQSSIARTAWSTAIALRYAWERNVRAVICDLDASAAPSAISLAERLSVPLGIHSGDLPTLALHLSALVDRPAASRARLVAGCAELIAQQSDIASILEVVEAELPGVRVRLSLGDANHETGAPGGFQATVRVPMGPLDLRSGRELMAAVERASTAWVRTVRTVLEIARAQIIACEAAQQVRLAQRRHLEEWTLGLLVAPAAKDDHSRQQLGGDRAALPEATERGRTTPNAQMAAGRLGWRLGPSLVAGMVVPRDALTVIDDDLDLAVAAAWPQDAGVQGPIRHRSGWAVWVSFEEDEDDISAESNETNETAAAGRASRALATTLARCVDDLGVSLPLAAGVGTPTDDVSHLATSLRHAELAARVARRHPTSVPTFRSVGALGFLAAADTPALRELAADALVALRDAEDQAALVGTLAVYLDCGGSTGRAADLLGVHRNTVSSRMDRVRRLGLDLDDPATRLGIHAAAHLLAD